MLLKKFVSLIVLTAMLGNTSFASFGNQADQSQALKEAWGKWVGNIHSLSDPSMKRAKMERTFEMYSAKLQETAEQNHKLSDADRQSVQTALAQVQGWQQELKVVSDAELDQFALWVQNQNEQAILGAIIALLVIAILVVVLIHVLDAHGRGHGCNHC